MPFKKTSENGGKRDPNISTKGRPSGPDSLKMKNKNDLGEEELIRILRGLKPLTKKSIAKLGVILEDGSEQAKMRAIIFILDKYKDLVDQLYINAEEEDEVDKNEIESAPVFSLKMVGDDKEEKK